MFSILKHAADELLKEPIKTGCAIVAAVGVFLVKPEILGFDPASFLGTSDPDSKGAAGVVTFSLLVISTSYVAAWLAGLAIRTRVSSGVLTAIILGLPVTSANTYFAGEHLDFVLSSETARSEGALQLVAMIIAAMWALTIIAACFPEIQDRCDDAWKRYPAKTNRPFQRSEAEIHNADLQALFWLPLGVGTLAYGFLSWFFLDMMAGAL